MKIFLAATLVLSLLTSTVTPAHCASPAEPILLWPGIAPGDKDDLGEEKDTSKPDSGKVAGKPVIRLGNVSKPSLTLFRPPKGKDTGAACPAGCLGGST